MPGTTVGYFYHSKSVGDLVGVTVTQQTSWGPVQSQSSNPGAEPAYEFQPSITREGNAPDLNQPPLLYL